MARDQLSSYLKSLPSNRLRADEIAVVSLRDAITSGVLVPGEEIDEDAVALDLSLSRMPVRQAMSVLEAEGLVEKPYRRRVRVRELTRDQIVEIYHMRSRLEGLAAERAVPNLADADTERIGATLQEIERVGDDLAAFSRLNLEFHLAIYRCSGWSVLESEIHRLRNTVASYIAVSHRFVSYLPQASGDHRDIYEACTARDAARARKETEAHVLRAMEALLGSLDVAEGAPR